MYCGECGQLMLLWDVENPDDPVSWACVDCDCFDRAPSQRGAQPPAREPAATDVETCTAVQ